MLDCPRGELRKGKRVAVDLICGPPPHLAGWVLHLHHLHHPHISIPNRCGSYLVTPPPGWLGPLSPWICPCISLLPSVRFHPTSLRCFHSSSTPGKWCQLWREWWDDDVCAVWRWESLNQISVCPPTIQESKNLPNLDFSWKRKRAKLHFLLSRKKYIFVKFIIKIEKACLVREEMYSVLCWWLEVKIGGFIDLCRWFWLERGGGCYSLALPLKVLKLFISMYAFHVIPKMCTFIAEPVIARLPIWGWNEGNDLAGCLVLKKYKSFSGKSFANVFVFWKLRVVCKARTNGHQLEDEEKKWLKYGKGWSEFEYYY